MTLLLYRLMMQYKKEGAKLNCNQQIINNKVIKLLLTINLEIDVYQKAGKVPEIIDK